MVRIVFILTRESWNDLTISRDGEVEISNKISIKNTFFCPLHGLSGDPTDVAKFGVKK